MHSCWLPPYYGSYCLTFQPLPARKAAGLHNWYCSGNILLVWIYTYLMLYEYTGAEHNSVFCLKHCRIDVWPWWNYNCCWLAVQVCDNFKKLCWYMYGPRCMLALNLFGLRVISLWSEKDQAFTYWLILICLQLYSRIFMLARWELSPLFAQKDNSYLKQGSLHKFQMNNYTEYDLVDNFN